MLKGIVQLWINCAVHKQIGLKLDFVHLNKDRTIFYKYKSFDIAIQKVTFPWTHYTFSCMTLSVASLMSLRALSVFNLSMNMSPESQAPNPNAPVNIRGLLATTVHRFMRGHISNMPEN